MPVLELVGERSMKRLLSTLGCLGFAERLDTVQNPLNDAGRKHKLPAWRKLQHVMLGQSLDDSNGLEGVIPLLQQPTCALVSTAAGVRQNPCGAGSRLHGLRAWGGFTSTWH